MSLHVLGIGGTFMAGVAALARELGDAVSGTDAGVYPPMSDQLAALAVTLHEGYDGAHIADDTGLVLIGNALSRGNPAVESVLARGLPYGSGAQWLGERIMYGRPTLAVAGTHGKTTTASILAWLLDCAGQLPGFLIGGIPENFGISARLGHTDAPFVVEADEYDTAFFDKRAKFVHYRPQVAVLNNLEFDHADIYPDLASIQRQFHHLVRTVPGNGRLVVNADDPALAQVLAMGCWTPVDSFGIDAGDWRAVATKQDFSQFDILRRGELFGRAHWPLLGRHNMLNALAAVVAAAAVGLDDPDVVLPALAAFKTPRRRLESLGNPGGIQVYDDFAHHPTAIATTLQGLRAHAGDARILVALEPRSNSMRMGVHAGQLAPALALADQVLFLARPELPWQAEPVLAALAGRADTFGDSEQLLAGLLDRAGAGDIVVFMSNGGFDGIPRRFVATLAKRAPAMPSEAAHPGQAP